MFWSCKFMPPWPQRPLQDFFSDLQENQLKGPKPQRSSTDHKALRVVIGNFVHKLNLCAPLVGDTA